MRIFPSHPLIHKLVILVIACLALVVSPANATGFYDLPSLKAGSSTWIVDQAEAISAVNEGKLNKELKSLAKKTGNELRMVVVRRLDFGNTIDGLAEEIFTGWYPTPESQAHQTLLVLDTLTNKTAIRYGEAVSPPLTDEIAESVLTETMAAPLKDGAKYNQALLDASARLNAVLLGQPDPGPPAAQKIDIASTFTTAEETDDQNATIWVIVLLALATIIPMATYFWYVGFPGR
ncbi:MAG: hypothetical protein N5P05_003692 [Chroococcopsis gigantea SAG 12.99]|jgi:uncharacterized protein|nr:TPM domain-containing protein [Chlorogloea purpurea SAG 13.99]MDV3002086.1 hypothetical protein [Chroococcopsis gigantea SAG 12.99]